MKNLSHKVPLALLSAALLSFATAGCGGKDTSSEAPKVSAGENVPPPAGKAWADIVVKTGNGGYLMGNSNAAIKVIEYGSLTCPHCAEFAEKSADEITKMVNSGRLSFEYRSYVRDPLDMASALLAECGGPEPFFPLSHQLFANQAAMYEKAQAAGDTAYKAAMEKAPAERFFALAQLGGLVEFVKERGISEDKAKQCLGDEKQITALAAQVQDANTKFDITGTPTLIMNGAVMENVVTWEAMRPKLAEAGL